MKTRGDFKRKGGLQAGLVFVLTLHALGRWISSHCYFILFFFILCLDSSNLHQKWNIVIISLILVCFWTYTTHSHLIVLDAAPFILCQKNDIRKRSPPSDNCHLGIGQFRPILISKLILLVCRLGTVVLFNRFGFAFGPF